MGVPQDEQVWQGAAKQHFLKPTTVAKKSVTNYEFGEITLVDFLLLGS